MNKMARSVLALYSYDDKADDTSMENVLAQSLSIIAKLPAIMVAGYQAKRRVYDNDSYFIHSPYHGISTAENILSMLRIDRKYTREEALLLDKCLILHAEHGGGNNSTFSVRLLSSSGTDTYSAIAAGIGSLKGPRHGGANISVIKMLDDMKEHIRDYKDDEEISEYLRKLFNSRLRTVFSDVQFSFVQELCSKALLGTGHLNGTVVAEEFPYLANYQRNSVG